MDDARLRVAGTGVCLPAARTTGDLAARLADARPLAGVPRRLAAEHTDLPVLDAPVGLCADPAPSRPVRLAGLPRESALALCAAADALGPPRGGAAGGADDGGDSVGVVWVSSTAGLQEYGDTCVAVATVDPGQASPLTACESAFNGPAAAVSIRLGLTGPHLTLTGGRDAGITALFEAGRLLAERRCRYVLVGGSASVSRWRLAGNPANGPAGAGPRGTGPRAPGLRAPGLRAPGLRAPGPRGANGDPPPDAAVPVEGAVCLLLAGPGCAGGGTARPLSRRRLTGRAPAAALAGFLDECRAGLAGPPDALAICAGPRWERAMGALDTGRARRWWVDRIGGELGAAGGLHAVVTAVASCGRAPAGIHRVLALAIGEAGDAGAVEVVRETLSRGKES